MPCYHPISAFAGPLRPDGKRSIFFSGDSRGITPLSLPCGRCIGCRLERSRQWAVRMTHEASFYDANCFVTLTYDDVHLPNDLSLDVSVWQRFAKRLRKRCGSFRFFAAGEYGETTMRPHYHACLFGLDFPDRMQSNLSSEHPLFVSEILSSVWPYGFSSIGDFSFETAAYVARYVTQKVTGDLAQSHYLRHGLDGSTWNVVPEFACMSRRPGIGSRWFDKYSSDVFPVDRVVSRGFPAKPPRFYDLRYESLNAENFSAIKERRKIDAERFLVDNSNRSLSGREEFAARKMSTFSRRGDV